jgi:hypothetical protein
MDKRIITNTQAASIQLLNNKPKRIQKPEINQTPMKDRNIELSLSITKVSQTSNLVNSIEMNKFSIFVLIVNVSVSVHNV